MLFLSWSDNFIPYEDQGVGAAASFLTAGRFHPFDYVFFFLSFSFPCNILQEITPVARERERKECCFFT